MILFHSHDEARHTAQRAAVGALKAWREDPAGHDYVCLVIDLRREFHPTTSARPWASEWLIRFCVEHHAQYAVLVWRVGGFVFCVLEHPLGRLAWLVVDGDLVPTEVTSPASTGCAPGGVVATVLEYAVEHTSI